ncbi:MAG TPA: hypothetical protein VGL58_09700 [Caulobacteraceae bacterium]|jgi:hypothetical protein
MAEATLPIDYPCFEGRGLALKPVGLWRGAAIVCDGQPLPRKLRTFTAKNNAGADVVFKLTGIFVDPIPQVQAPDRTIQLAKPFAWYDYVVIVLPLALIGLGGALGGLCGGMAAYTNAQLLRSNLTPPIRYLAALGVMLAAGVVWLVLAALFVAAIGR